MMDGLSLMVISCFLPFSLSLPEKVHVRPLFFLFFNFNSYVFYCLFSFLAL